jgi:ABC-type nickel/cobalt efflux system permease component RcnA
MQALRSAAVAVVVAGLLYLMLDSGTMTPERAAPLTSLSLGALALLFGVGGWAMKVGGQPERVPLLVGLAVGIGGYALARLVF